MVEKVFYYDLRGIGNGVWQYFDSKNNKIGTEYWNSNKTVKSWTVFMDENDKVVLELANAVKFRIINYNGEVDEETSKYAAYPLVFPASEYNLNKQKLWEGFIVDPSGEGSVINERTYVKVGLSTTCLIDGKIKSKGFYQRAKDDYNHRSFKVEYWYYYDQNGAISKRDKHNNRGRVYESLNSAQLEAEKVKFDQLITSADKLEKQEQYDEAIEHYKKASFLRPMEAQPKNKIEKLKKLIRGHKEALAQEKRLFDQQQAELKKLTIEVQNLYKFEDKIKTSINGYTAYS